MAVVHLMLSEAFAAAVDPIAAFVTAAVSVEAEADLATVRGMSGSSTKPLPLSFAFGALLLLLGLPSSARIATVIHGACIAVLVAAHRLS